MWVIQEVTKIYLTLCPAKSLCMKCFDVDKLHSRVQASTFGLFILIKRRNVSDV